MMRVYAWRHDTASLEIDESRVMSLLIFAIAISTVAFGASFDTVIFASENEDEWSCLDEADLTLSVAK